MVEPDSYFILPDHNTTAAQFCQIVVGVSQRFSDASSSFDHSPEDEIAPQGTGHLRPGSWQAAPGVLQFR